MSNKGKRHNKSWLISRLKTSGSKRRYVIDGDYSDTRNSKRNKDWENLPKSEGMGQSFKFFNEKINYGMLVRFLKGKVGGDWNDIQVEIEQRIPTDLLEYRSCVNWFVADLVEIRSDGLWDKREQKYLRIEPDNVVDWDLFTSKEFYVEPKSNLLRRIGDFPSKRKTKGMDSDQLRVFRENEKRAKMEEKGIKKGEQEEVKKKMKELLKKNGDQELL